MNPANKGWLVDYLNFRRDHHLHSKATEKTLSQSGLYQSIQPSGLLYGHPVRFVDVEHPKASKWDSDSKTKIIFLDSIYHAGYAQLEEKPDTHSDWRDFFHEVSQQVADFYLEASPELLNRPWYSMSFGKKKSGMQLSEYFIDKRIYAPTVFDSGFWSSFFHNSLLFLDTYYFGEWKAKSVGDVKEKRDLAKLELLKVIAASAHANHSIEREERNMFNFFLSSASLPSDKAEEAKKSFTQGITLADLDLKGIDSWLLKKYILELAILTVWADRVVTDQEKDFLEKLAGRLGFSSEELDQSMVAIESFVVENWQSVHFLQSKHSFALVSQTLIKRLSFVMSKNKDSLAQELRESKELWQLLEKSRKESLTNEEKEKVRAQIIDVLKTLPAFVIVALPGTFLTLPILLKILPPSVLPSAFRE